MYKQCINTELLELGCEDVTWIEMAQDYNQWWGWFLVSTANRHGSYTSCDEMPVR